MIKVTCELQTYHDTAKPSVKVHNHWNQTELVELEVNGERFVVKGTELIGAVKNCMNTVKY